MFRYILVSLILAILTCAAVFFLWPVITPEWEIVSIVAEQVLRISNRFFDPMPPVLVDYLSGLTLLSVAATAGIVVLVLFLVTTSAWQLLVLVARVAVYLFRRREPPRSRELSNFEFEPGRVRSHEGPRILGRGFDSV